MDFHFEYDHLLIYVDLCSLLVPIILIGSIPICSNMCWFSLSLLSFLACYDPHMAWIRFQCICGLFFTSFQSLYISDQFSNPIWELHHICFDLYAWLIILIVHIVQLWSACIHCDPYIYMISPLIMFSASYIYFEFFYSCMIILLAQPWSYWYQHWSMYRCSYSTPAMTWFTFVLINIHTSNPISVQSWCCLHQTWSMYMCD